MKLKYVRKLLSLSILSLTGLFISVNVIAKINPQFKKVQFVAKVSKKCKHIGSIRETIVNRKIFGFRKKGEPRSMKNWIKNGHDVFTARMKQKAVAKGANRLVIKDIDYDMDISSHRGFVSYNLKRTYIRARAFRCR